MIQIIKVNQKIKNKKNLEDETFGCVYKRLFPSGKFYIGITIQSNPKKRWSAEDSSARKDMKYQPKLFNALRKYNYKTKDSIILDNIPASLLDDYERFFIKYYDSYNKGYNSTIGGEINYGENHPMYGENHTKEARKKISDRETNAVFGFKGASLISKNKDTNKPWRCRIKYNFNGIYIGVFEDPLTCTIIYNLIKEEIYK